MNCSECGGLIITIDYMEICSECGLIELEEKLVQSSYLVGLRNEDYAPPTQKAAIITGFVYPVVFDKNDIFKKPKTKYAQISLKEQTIHYVYAHISTFCRLLHIWHLRNQVRYEYKKITNQYSHIRNRIILIVALLYYVIRREKLAIQIETILKVVNNRGHRVRKKLIVQTCLRYRIKIPPVKYSDYLPSIIAKVESDKIILTKIMRKNISFSDFQKILRMPVSAKNVNLTMLNQYHLAAAIVYAKLYQYHKRVGKWLVTQKDISQALNIKEYSLRDMYTNIFNR